MEKLQDFYEKILNLGDPRVYHWLLMSSPLPMLMVLSAYLVMVWLGPKLMQNHQPFDLRRILVAYNLAMVLLSAYLFGELFQVVVKARYSLFCQPVDRSNNPLALRMAEIVWLGFMTKIIELMDTFFFILRKKNTHISFLHVYHHCSIVITLWTACKYAPGGQNFLNGMTNTVVHMFMYTYYGLSALGPRVRKYLWWKRHVTQLQLVQFFIVTLHVLSGLLLNCGYPVWMSIYELLYTASITALFINFYIQAYLRHQHKNNALKHN